MHIGLLLILPNLLYIQDENSGSESGCGYTIYWNVYGMGSICKAT